MTPETKILIKKTVGKALIGIGLIIICLCILNLITKDSLLENQIKTEKVIRNVITNQARLDLLMPAVVVFNGDSSKKKELNDSIISQISSILARKYLDNSDLKIDESKLSSYFVFSESPDINGNYKLTKEQLNALTHHLSFLASQVDKAVVETRQEVSSELSRINNWLSLWIFIIGCVAVFIPILVNFKSFEELKTIGRKAENTQSNVEKSQTQITELDTKVTSATAKANEATTKANEAVTNSNKSIENLEKINQQIQKADIKINESETKITTIEKQVNEATEKAMEATQNAIKSSEDLKKIENKAVLFEQKVAITDARAEESDKKINELEKEINDASQKISKVAVDLEISQFLLKISFIIIKMKDIDPSSLLFINNPLSYLIHNLNSLLIEFKSNSNMYSNRFVPGFFREIAIRLLQISSYAFFNKTQLVALSGFSKSIDEKLDGGLTDTSYQQILSEMEILIGLLQN